MSGYRAVCIEDEEEYTGGGEEVTLNLLVNAPIPTTLPVSLFNTLCTGDWYKVQKS